VVPALRFNHACRITLRKHEKHRGLLEALKKTFGLRRTQLFEIGHQKRKATFSYWIVSLVMMMIDHDDDTFFFCFRFYHHLIIIIITTNQSRQRSYQYPRMFLPTSIIKMYDSLLVLLLLPFFTATTVRTADACSCRPTWTINNAMHAASSVVRVWVSWEMDPPAAVLPQQKQLLRGGTGIGTTHDPDDLTLPLLDIDAPRYYMVEASHWFKKDDDDTALMDLQTGKFIVKTPRQSSLCGVTLPHLSDSRPFCLAGPSITNEYRAMPPTKPS
jgi:hypothetical protein